MSFNYYSGPYVADLTPSAPLPATVLDWFEISKEKVGPNTTDIHVAVSVAAGVDFSSLRIYANGYLGIFTDIRVAQSSKKTFSFTLKATNETMTLKAVVVNSAGVESSLITALTALVTLDLQSSSVPVRVSGLKAVDGNAGTTILFNAGTEGFLLGYRLYRSLRAQAFAVAVLVGSIMASPDSDEVVMFDIIKGAALYNWYVTSVSKTASVLNLDDRTGESTPSQAVFPLVTF